MDLIKIIQELEIEQQRISEALAVIRRLGVSGVGVGGGKRRGRPPEWLRKQRQTLQQTATLMAATQQAPLKRKVGRPRKVKAAGKVAA